MDDSAGGRRQLNGGSMTAISEICINGRGAIAAGAPR